MDALILVCLYFSGFVFFSLVLVGIVTTGKPLRHLLNPGVLFCLIFGFVYFLMPMASVVTSQYRFDQGYALEIHLKAFSFNILFGLFVIVAYEVFGGTRRYCLWQMASPRVVEPTARAVCVFLVPLAVLTTIGMSQLFNAIQAYGVTGFIGDRTALLQGQGYYQLLSMAGLVMVGAASAAYWASRGSRRKALLGALVVSLLLTWLPAMLVASRTRLLMPLLLIYLTWLFVARHGALRLSRVVSGVGGISLILVLALTLGHVREIVMLGAEIEGGIIDRDIVVERLTSGSIESLGNNENLLWLMSNPGSTDTLYGTTFAAAATGFIPRTLWPDKPLGGGPALRNFIVPGSYDLSTGVNLTSFTTGLPVEAYMNFGFWGVALGLLYGLALSFLAGLLLRVKTVYGVGLWVLFLHIGLVLTMAEFFGAVSYMYSYIVVWAAAVLFSRIVKLSGRTVLELKELSDRQDSVKRGNAGILPKFLK